jgi:hypothetical protein
VSVADNDDLSFGSGSADSPFSISAWINPVDATNFTIVSKGVFNTDAEYIFQLDGDDKLFFSLYDESVSNTYEGAYFNTALTSYQGSWFHVCATYNGVGGTSANAGIKLYIDGVEKSTSLIGGGTYVAMENLGGELEIGRISSTYANGKISNLALYKTQLDAQTIKQFAKSRFTPVRNQRFSAVSLDGSNDYIAVPDNDSLDIGTGNVTVSAWVKPADLDANHAILDKRGSDQLGIQFMIHSGDRFFFQISDGTDDYYDYSGSLLTLGQWHHICAVWNPSTTYAKFYLDGVDVGRQFGSTNANVGNSDNTSELRLGRSSDGYTNNYFDGSISSVSLYNVEKSSEEVYALYSKGITYNESSESGLVGLWRMGDDTSKAYPTIADSSSNSNDGTITNGASDDIVQQMVAGYDMGAFESTGQEFNGNLVDADASTFEGTSTYGWAVYGNNTVTNDSNTLKITRVDNNQGAYLLLKNATDLTTDLTVGTTYLLSADFLTTDATKTYTARVSNGTQDVTHSALNNTSFETKTFEFVAQSTTNAFLVVESMQTDGIVKVDNILLQEEIQSSDLSDTYPALIDVTEPVLGAELVGSGFYTLSNWTTSNTKSNPTATSVKFVNDASDNAGAYIYLKNANNELTTDLTVGEYYKITLTFTTDDGDAYPVIKDSSNNYYSFGATSGEKVLYYKAVHATADRIMFQGVSTDTFVQIADVSIKQVSGNVGTMTNQDSADLVYSSVLPDQSFLTGVNSAYNFIDLGGTDEYVSVDGIVSDMATQTGTINLWVKPSSDTGNTIVVFTYNDNNARSDMMFRYNFGASNRLEAGLAQGGTQKWETYTATNSATSHIGNWTMITLVHDGSDPICYINGVDAEWTVVNSSDKTFWLGDMSGVDKSSLGIWNYTSLDNAFIGKIGQSAVWNKNLSASEILAIYNLGRHGNLLDKYSDNLVGNWAMSSLDSKTGLSDVGDGTIYDRSGNSNHGTATNTESADLASSPNAEPNGYAKGDTNRSTTIP